MGRRKILVIVAVLVAAMGTGVVALYVKGANSRADQKFAATQVLVAKEAINPGETVAAAKTAGKFETKTVTTGSLVPGAVSDMTAIPDTEAATTTIFPGEQILSSKFGSTAAASGSQLTMEKGQIAISISLSDTGRVAGFVNPGDHVAIFAVDAKTSATRVLLPDVVVIAVGSTTTIPKTTTDAAGTQTVEQLPRTMFTLGLNEADAERVIHASTASELTFGLRNDASTVTGGPGITDDNLFK